MQLTFDADVEAFRAEFIAFLDRHLPSEVEAAERSRSTSHVPKWARRWQQLQFDHGWLLPGNPPQNSAGAMPPCCSSSCTARSWRDGGSITCSTRSVGIIAASLLSFGTDEQKQRWAVPILRAEMTASLG